MLGLDEVLPVLQNELRLSTAACAHLANANAKRVTKKKQQITSYINKQTPKTKKHYKTKQFHHMSVFLIEIKLPKQDGGLSQKRR